MKTIKFSKNENKNSTKSSSICVLIKSLIAFLVGIISVGNALAASIEFNNSGGTTSTNGLHFYIEDTTHIQVRRLNNTGQVYSPSATPPSSSLDNGIFIRANGKTYGPSHNVTTFNPTGGMYSTYSISAASPANPTTSGDQQTATANFGITSGPQVSVLWKYTTPLDFLTAEVTLTIPSGYSVSAANPVRYYHVFDTYLGGSDSGCGVSFTDSNGKFVIGTYPPASGTNCPSSTGIPTGVSVVESFRERSGLNFSHYCSAGWSTFYVNGTPNCSVLQTASMSNTVVTSYQDTGIGVELDFTASGTYTFSYDFVIGSPNVPPYDHLEIQHDGAGTLCPDTVIVLACTSSTVPCPIASRVNTGTLTGSITTTPATPSVTKSPSTFTIGSIGTTAAIALQGASPGGTYILDSTGLSTVPLNGTKCWNTTTNSQSCSFTVSNTPCISNFECLETGLTYSNLTTTPTARNPLYTKLSGTNFKFDVVALQSGGIKATSYTAGANVTVELFDDSTPPSTCSAYTNPIASQAITFASTDAGQKTLATNFNITNAYKKLRCRVKDTNMTPTVYGCSSDQFSVRPSSVTLSTSATATPPSASATPSIKAGANFSLSASTNASSSYSGILTLDTGKLTAQTTTQVTTLQNGGTIGTLSPSTLTANNTAISATYSEIGYLYLAPGAYRDETFTAVDSGTGDCITDTTSDNNLSDTLVSSTGKYGCHIGNNIAVSFGRFYPDHFAISGASLSAACTTNTPFSYFGQDGFTTQFTLTAQNSTNNTTQNYSGKFAKMDPTNYSLYSFSAATLPVGSSLASSATAPSGNWVTGVANITAKHQINRPTALTAETSITISTAPSDGEVVAITPSALGSPTKLRYGQLKMQNAYGSELLPLSVPFETQYWNGSSFIRNVDDSCTSLTASNIALNYHSGSLNSTNMGIISISSISGGLGAININKPNPSASGSVDLLINLGSSGSPANCPNIPSTGSTSASKSFLSGKWCGSAYDRDPISQATFGIYKTPIIYIRENY